MRDRGHEQEVGEAGLRFGRLERGRLLPTFVEAFSDYAVDMSHVTRELKEARALKNNVDWDVSVGVFDGERMVAFTLIAVDDWSGHSAAFDAATGVVPGYRGRGLAGRMLEHALPELRRRGVTRFVLEVLQQNEPAIRAYRRSGFEVERAFDCFAVEPARLSTGPDADHVVSTLPRGALAALDPQMDWRPSWENGPRAIARIPDALVVLGVVQDDLLVGSIVYSPLLGWIMALVVHREHRGRGVASSLLRGLIDRLPRNVAQVRLVNVDGEDSAMRAFLERRGFVHTVSQFEMVRRI